MTDKASLIATTTLLDRMVAGALFVYFDTDPQEVGDRPSSVVSLPKETWEELGEPGSITVTVKAGDHLNLS